MKTRTRYPLALFLGAFAASAATACDAPVEDFDEREAAFADEEIVDEELDASFDEELDSVEDIEVISEEEWTRQQDGFAEKFDGAIVHELEDDEVLLDGEGAASQAVGDLAAKPDVADGAAWKSGWRRITKTFPYFNCPSKGTLYGDARNYCIHRGWDTILDASLSPCYGVKNRPSARRRYIRFRCYRW